MHTFNKFSGMIAGLFLVSAIIFSCNESKNENQQAGTETKTVQADTVKSADKKSDKPKADQPNAGKASKGDKKVTDNSKKGS